MWGARVRRATIEDAATIAAVHIASADDAYRPLAAEWRAPDAVAREAMWRETLASGLVLIADDGGFAHGGPARRAEPNVTDEVYAIHVLPAQRGRGLGTALWNAIRAQLGALYVDTLGELACCRFYERHGGQRIEERPFHFYGAERTHVTYRFAITAASRQSSGSP